MKRAVIYTSLTGGYDDLPQHEVIDSDFDYVCFSNDYPAETKVGQWVIRPIPIESNDKILLSRYAKLMPHAVFPDYEYSIWLDANLIIITREIYTIIKSHIAHGSLWAGIKHPERDCIYDDIRECILCAKVSYNAAIKQLRFLQSEGYPKHYGLYENNLILRRHNISDVRDINEDWWRLYNIYTRRDQFSLFYLFWKHSFIPDHFFENGQNTHNSRSIKFLNHSSPSRCFRIKRKMKVLINKFILTIHHI